jgi:hypothetical protein
MLLYPSLKRTERSFHRLRRFAARLVYENRKTKDFSHSRPDKMANPVTNLETCTDEELENTLARVLVYASGKVLKEAEVRIFYQLYEEIRRRLPAVTAA